MRDVKVLVVDDSKTVQIVIGEVLMDQLGIKQIYPAFNGVRALEILRESHVDFILSDWNMPELSGEELLYEVKQNSEWADIPFVMMSSNHHRDFIITAIQLGVSDYIMKPFKPDELEAVVRKVWNKSKKIAMARAASLPEYSLTITVGGEPVPARLMGINRASVLIRLEYSEKLRLFVDYELNLNINHPDFPTMDGEFIIGPFKGALRRIEAEEALKGISKMCDLSLSLGSTKIDKVVERNLDRLLLWIKEHSAAYIED